MWSLIGQTRKGEEQNGRAGTVRVKAAGVWFYFEVLSESGPPPGERPCLVAFHGGPGLDHTALRPGIDSLCEHFQVVLVDQRGHGRSDRSSPASWNLDRWADDVAEFCDALDLVKPLVLGVSFGGTVVLRYAQRHPDHPGGIVCVSASARRDRAASVRIFEHLGGPEVAQVAERHFTDPTAETAVEYGRVCMPFYFSTRAPLSSPGGIRNVELMLHWLQGEDRTFDLRPELPVVQCPTLVMAGDADPVTPVHLAHEIHEGLVARSDLVVVNDAGHGVFRDKPRDFARAVHEWARDRGHAPGAQR
jgi:pimeloyl-ACP methyl ester carboxylesterase